VRLAAREGEGRRARIALATPRSRGGRAALTQVYQQHHQALYRYCCALLRDDHDAQDALQSTMTRAFAALRDERRDFELRPWLFRIAHNESINILRRRRPVEELDELVATAAPVEEQVALNADLETLRRDLDALPQRQHAALVLRELNGLSHEEIGQALDCRPELVKQAIYQARTALMHAREGREMECGEVRKALSDGDGRVLRGTRLRAHLRSCKSCRSFQDDLARRPGELALLVPPLPVAAGVALLERLLPGGGAGVAGVMAAFTPKAITTVAVVAATATGASTVARHHHRPPPPPPAAATPARATAPAALTRAASPGGGTNATTAASVPTGRAPGKSATKRHRGGARGQARRAAAKNRSRRHPAKTRSRRAEAKTRSPRVVAKRSSRAATAKTKARGVPAHGAGVAHGRSGTASRGTAGRR
jgi:RNA polymerase sigma factor (sigma-70 family)